MSTPLFTKLSGSYFWYFSILGMVVPFLPIYLDGNGFSSLQIGEILAIVTATKIVGPTLWAMMADKSGKQLAIIRLGALLAFLSFSLLFWVQGYWPITFVLALFSLFWTAILPQLEVLTLVSVRRNAKIYARIRLWGSVGFIVLAIAAGEVIAQWSYHAFTFLGLFVLFALYLSTLLLKEPHAKKQSNIKNISIFSKLVEPRFIFFFIAGLLLQISFGPFYSFFALYLRDLAYPGYAVGLYISLGVIAEIGVFIIAGRLYQLFGVRVLLTFSLLLTAARWFITGYYADNPYILTLAQLTHAASFGLYHSVSIQFVQQHFHINQQNRGQAIYISGVYGIGGAIGAYFAGRWWLDGAGAELSFELAGVAALLAALFAVFIYSEKDNKQ